MRERKGDEMPLRHDQFEELRIPSFGEEDGSDKDDDGSNSAVMMMRNGNGVIYGADKTGDTTNAAAMNKIIGNGSNDGSDDNDHRSSELNLSFDASHESGNDEFSYDMEERSPSRAVQLEPMGTNQTAKVGNAPGQDSRGFKNGFGTNGAGNNVKVHNMDTILNGVDLAQANNFPTIEVTVSRDNSSTASDANYDFDYSSDHEGMGIQTSAPVSPMSPPTPSHDNGYDLPNNVMNALRNTHANRHAPANIAGSREANNLMNVLQKVSSKRQSYNDIHMGAGRNNTPPRNKNRNRDKNRNRNRNKNRNRNRRKGNEYDSSSDDSSDATPTRNHAVHTNDANRNAHTKLNLNRTQPKPSHNRQVSFSNVKDNARSANGNGARNAQAPLSPASSYYQSQRYSQLPQPPPFSPRRAPSAPNLIQHKPEDPTLLAQTFVLSLAFFSVWSPQNLMAPNLTQMADYFHFTADQRDLYLGANIAFATGVLSLPVSALLGFLADIVASRKRLFAYTVFMGGLAAVGTGRSTTYVQLYFWRFLCGGCMSGSVPIAFSILGDLFDAKDRNAASSGLTAMMGAGILLGQVVAGMIGGVDSDPFDVNGCHDGSTSSACPDAANSDNAIAAFAMSAIENAMKEGLNESWKRPFYISGFISMTTSLMVLYFVREPVRGGKEKVLQEMIASGTKYDRKLTLSGFCHAMTQNKTNVILMLQGFFTNIPWGVIFTFLNDYLSQEQGLSVTTSTIIILWFGVGSAVGMVIGGYIGTIAMRINSALLPLFMALSTILGILPFLGLLDLDLKHAWFLALFLAFSGGAIPNFPSANVRPCLLNVNPPETRGAAMTAANLMINVARGAGPSLVTLSQSVLGVSRQYSFNLTIIAFWSFTTVLLVILAKTLPSDQEKMDAELARYAKSKINSERTRLMEANGMTMNGRREASYGSGVTITSTMDDEVSEADIISMIRDDMTLAGEESIVSIEDRITTFDASAVQESWSFIEGALREIAELSHMRRSNYEVIRRDDDNHEIVLSADPNDPVNNSEERDLPDQYGIGNETKL